MADKKDEKDKPKRDPAKEIKKYEENREMADMLIETTKTNHQKAYLAAADKLLWDKKKGVYNHNLLKEQDVRDTFKKELIKNYTTLATDYFEKKDPSPNPLKNEQLMQAYAGVTSDKINELVEIHQHKYKIGKHKEKADELMKKVSETLYTGAKSHLQQSDIPHILKHIGADKVIDATKVQTIDDVLNLYSLKKEQGSITKEGLTNLYREQGVPAPTFFIEEKKDKEYKKAA